MPSNQKSDPGLQGPSPLSDPEFEAGMLAMVAAEIVRVSSVTSSPKDSRTPDRGNHSTPRPISRRPARRNPKDEKIDRILQQIAESSPKNHKEAFDGLDGRAPIANAKPFKTAGDWLAGFEANPRLARAWLSKRWARLNLPAFRRGPK
jgi:hypothetical protein